MERIRNEWWMAVTLGLAVVGGCVAEDDLALSPVDHIETELGERPEDFAIVVPGSNLCLAATGTVDGDKVEQQSCNSARAQRWDFRPVETGGANVYTIASRWNGKVLDIEGVSTAPGALVHQWQDVGGANQRFEVREVAAGVVQLRPTHTQECVSVVPSPADRSTGARFQQARCDARDWRQQFRIERRGRLEKKALLVLLENEGFPGGLAFDPAVDVATGIAFSCDRWSFELGLGTSIADAIRRAVELGMPPWNSCVNPGNWQVSTRTRRVTAREVIRQSTDFVVEEISRSMIVQSPAARQYDAVVVLEDGDFTGARLRQELRRLAGAHTIDVHVLAHGNEHRFGPGDGIDVATLQQLRDIPGLDLRAVYQQNCTGSWLNAVWRQSGADVVSGTVGVNHMPLAYVGFLHAWGQNQSFATAVTSSVEATRGMHALAYRFVDIHDEGSGQVRLEIGPFGQLSPDDELAASVPVIDGDGGLVLGCGGAWGACFGAVGVRCQGIAMPTGWMGGCTAEGCLINAGSIDHDQCCWERGDEPNAMMCGTQLGNVTPGGPCTASWNRAVHRTLRGLSWRRAIDQCFDNDSGTVNNIDYCAPRGTVVASDAFGDDTRRCCSKSARPLRRFELVPFGLVLDGSYTPLVCE